MNQFDIKLLANLIKVAPNTICLRLNAVFRVRLSSFGVFVRCMDLHLHRAIF